MSKPIIRIHDMATNEVIDREMTAAEYKIYQADQVIWTANQEKADAQATAKAAILDRIGLTADELQTILG